MILNVRHFEMVRAIQEDGTLTGASRRLYMSQPALSRQLAKLERRIGTKLFRRHREGMTPTPEGDRLLQSADRILEEITRAEQDVKLLADGYCGTVRVTTESYMCYHWLPRVARAFGARCPGVEVQLVAEAAQDPYGALERAGVDLALVYSAPPNAAAVDRAAIFEDELVAVVGRDHPVAAEPQLTPERFRTETLLRHQAEPGNEILEAFLESAGVRPKRIMELRVTPAVIEMARAGYGVAVVPRWVLDAQGPLDGLVVLPLNDVGIRMTWYAAWQTSRDREPVLGSMIEVVRDELGHSGRSAEDACRPRIQLA